VDLLGSEQKMKIFITVSTEYRSVTDGRTDGQTDRIPIHISSISMHADTQ